MIKLISIKSKAITNKMNNPRQHSRWPATLVLAACLLISQVNSSECKQSNHNHHKPTSTNPSQCTFGELSAQVMRPNEPSYNSISSNSLYNQNTYSPQQQRLLQQQQLNLINKRLSALNANNQQPMNIHHQRMLLQQLQQGSYGSHVMTHEQHSRLHHHNHQLHPRAMRQVVFDQPISFPFNFTWPGGFSLIVDAFYESPTSGYLQQVALPSRLNPATTYDLYKKQMIIQHSMHGYLSVKNEWTNGVHKTDSATLAYSYRVTCQPNYYGEFCNILCRPRDDVYGHFTCSQAGEVVCLAGWQGKYCEEPICLPGCRKDQGDCLRPNECNCRFGWQGASCEQCVRYPGCVHGTCNRPHECICEEGWGGLLCNEDLNYCTNHQPCKNGALCTNTFDVSGEGSYNCTCEEGFTGKNCERRIVSPTLPPNSNKALELNQTTEQLYNNNQATSTLTSSNNNNINGNSNQPKQASPAVASQQQQHQATRHQSRQQAQGPLSSPQFAQPVLAMTSPSSSSSVVDPLVMAAYGIIVVCLLIMLVYLLLRVSLDRFSNQHRLGAGSTGSDSPVWSTYGHSGHHGRQSHRHRSSRSHKRSLANNPTGVEGADDVATLQNNQNIYKSRTSLSTDKVPFSDVVDNSISDTCSSASSSDIDGPLDAYHVVGHHPASSRSLRLPYAQHHHYHHGPYAAYHPVAAPPPAAVHSSAYGHCHSGHRRHHHRATGGGAAAAIGHRAPPSHAYSVYNLSSGAHQSASVHHLNDYLSYSTNQSIALAQHQPPPPPYASISAQTASNRVDATYGRSLAAGQSTSAIYHPASMCLPSLYSNAGLAATNKSNSQVYGQREEQHQQQPDQQQQQQQQQHQSSKPNEQP